MVEASRRRPRPQEELYDLHADPDEMRNLAGRPEATAMEASLRQELDQWMRETGDPLPARNIPYPLPGKKHFLNNMEAPMPAEDFQVHRG